MYLGSPLCFAAMQRWSRVRKWGTTIGVVILIASLLSWASQMWHLILTQRALYGTGGTFLYSPIILHVDERFVRRKGLAYGVMCVSYISFLSTTASQSS